MSGHAWTGKGGRYEARDEGGELWLERQEPGRMAVATEEHGAFAEVLRELLLVSERLAEAERERASWEAKATALKVEDGLHTVEDLLGARERWIPVEERLPEREGPHPSRWVLVWCRSEGAGPYPSVEWCSVACRVFEDGWRWELHTGRPRDLAITHWRELPKGPA